MAQLVLAEELETGGRGGEHADRPAHDGGGGGMDPSVGPALVVAGRSEELLEDVVRPWHPRDVVAVEQAGPVAGADLEEVRHGRLEGADACVVVPDLDEEILQVLSHLAAGE